MVTCSMKKMKIAHLQRKWLYFTFFQYKQMQIIFPYYTTTKVILEFFLVQHNNRRSLCILDKDLIRWLSEANFRTMGIPSLQSPHSCAVTSPSLAIYRDDNQSHYLNSSYFINNVHFRIIVVSTIPSAVPLFKS